MPACGHGLWGEGGYSISDSTLSATTPCAHYIGLHHFVLSMYMLQMPHMGSSVPHHVPLCVSKARHYRVAIPATLPHRVARVMARFMSLFCCRLLSNERILWDAWQTSWERQQHSANGVHTQRHSDKQGHACTHLSWVAMSPRARDSFTICLWRYFWRSTPVGRKRG